LNQEIEDVSALPLTGAGSALGDLQTIARRADNPALMSAVRRVAWQLANATDRIATVERQAQSLSERFETVVKQRDELSTTLRTNGSGTPAALQARIERQGEEVRRAILAAKAAELERDEARMNWEKLRDDNQKLRSELGTFKSAKPGVPGEPPKAPKKPVVPDYILAIPAPEPSAEEATMMAERAKVVAEADRLVALGKKRSPTEHARLVTLQAMIAEFAPKVKAYKAARHAERMRREAEVMAAEAMKAAGLA
jgi:hypothetical protein